MSSYKTYVNGLGSELNHYNQPIVITLHIEYIMLITDSINAVESILDIGESKSIQTSSFSHTILLMPLLIAGLLCSIQRVYFLI